MKRPRRIVITTGDEDGIGSEITGKALSKLKPKKGIQFLVWRGPKCPKSHIRKMENHFERVQVSSWHEALALDPSDHKTIVDICSDLSPANWVETSAKAANFGHIDALVTAPLSKTTIKNAGFSDIGHTDILKRTAKTKDAFMAFLGDEMNVVLATGHIPIGEVPNALTSVKLVKAIKNADVLRQSLKKKISAKPIGLVGLNPHAGESGLIGIEEQRVFKSCLKKCAELKINVSEPLVPDVAFNEANLRKHSIYVTPYHDQGLIPFKMLHGDKRGVHMTLGLPFIRTSVDHGTAKDIFGKNKANYNSMLEAVEYAVKLAIGK
ncbi:MAG: PdxA family protein [Bdellovibrionales bacterium]